MSEVAATRRQSFPHWVWYLGAQLIAACLYFLLPRANVVQAVVFLVAGFSVVPAILGGIGLNRPDHRSPWFLLTAGAILAMGLANVIWYLWPVALHRVLPYPSIADGLYLTGYGVLLSGLAMLVRTRAGGRDRAGMIDTAIITIGLTVLSWVFLISPNLHASGLPLPAKITSISYPLVDVLFAAVLVRLALMPAARTAAYWLLSLYMLGQLGADTAYGLAVLDGSFRYGHPMFTGWFLSYAFLGAAALHPSMRALSEPVPEAQAGVTRARMLFLAGAALLSPAIMAIQAVRDQEVDHLTLSVVSAVVFVLVIARLRSLTTDVSDLKRAQAALGESELKFRSIIETANEAVVGMDSGGLITEWNRHAETTFGWPRHEAIGRVLSDTIMPARYKDAHTKGLERFLATGEGPVLNKRLELEALHRDGHEFPTELTISAIRVGSSAGFIAFVHDITERKQSEEALRESEATLRAVFAASPDIITMLGADGQIGAPSPAVEGVLGYDFEEYVKMDRLALVHPDDQEQAIQALRAVMEGGKTFEIRYRVRHADGHWVMLETRAQTMDDEEGHLIGAVTVSRDVTERVALDEALLRAKDDADRANRAKSEFLSRMSHELRTPLNAILGFGQLLEMDGLDEKHAESVQQILKGGRHLLDLINEVLDIARIESERLTMSLEPIVLSDALLEALDLIRPLAADQRIELRTEDSWPADRYVKADRQRLKQVLLNLLSNAVKYNREEGTVTVRCVEAGGGLRVEVSDDGPGIRPEMLERLFVPFERLGAEATGVEGTGLGLALSKGLMEAMGGKLGVESALGQGSTFLVELPLAEALETIREGGEALVRTAVGVPAGSHTILYIEDNLANVKLIEAALNHRPGLILLTAMQGGLGLDLARQHQPGLILLDLHLPDLPGKEVLRHLQLDPRTRGTPVIVISADATPGQIRDLLAAGAQAYLTKPIDVSNLLEVIDVALAEGRLDEDGQWSQLDSNLTKIAPTSGSTTRGQEPT